MKNFKCFKPLFSNFGNFHKATTNRKTNVIKTTDILRSKQKGLGKSIQILECPPLESAITIKF